MKKKYGVMVIEKHSDCVWVDAESDEEAKRLALPLAECEFEHLSACEIVDEIDIIE